VAQVNNESHVVLLSPTTFVSSSIEAANASASFGGNATLTATPKDSIEFDPRGFVVLPASTPKLIVTRATGADTLCVTGLGRIAVSGC